MDRAKNWRKIFLTSLGLIIVGSVFGLIVVFTSGTDQSLPSSNATSDIPTAVAPDASIIPSTEDLTEKAASLSSTADAVCAESKDAITAQDNAAKNATFDETGARIISPAAATINSNAADFRQRCASATRAKDFSAGAVKDRESDPLSFTVDMSVSVTSGNPLTVSGTTNLPDGTKLSIALKGDTPTCLPRCGFEFNSVNVQGGHFTSKIKADAPLISDSYTIDVVTPAAFGDSAKHLRGPYVVTLGADGSYIPLQWPPKSLVPSTDINMGIMIHYTQKIIVLDGGEVHVIPCPNTDQTDPGIGCETASN